LSFEARKSRLGYESLSTATTLILLSMAERFCSVLSSKGVLSAGQQGASLQSEEAESFPVFFFQSISISWDKVSNKIGLFIHFSNEYMLLHFQMIFN
jgi:hypothetical protein